MSPKKIVNQLQSICTHRVSNIIVHALSEENCERNKNVEKYFSNSTFLVLQDLLKYILNSENLDAATRFNCLKVLLKHNVQVLETGIFPYSYYVKILRVIIKSGTGLQQLNLKGLWVHDQPELLEEVIRRLKNLKVLIIPHIAADFILKPIAECSQLSVLDISGECYFSANELSSFKSSSIKVLIIGSYGKKFFCEPEEKSFEVLASIIENLPNLTAIRTYSFVGCSLCNIYERNPSFKSKLVYLHDTQTTIDAGVALVAMCSLLESLYLDFPKETVLISIKQLKYIISLKLSRFEYDELVDYLQEAGDQLRTLQLYNMRHVPVDLSYISLTCPNIVHLDLYRLSLTVSQPDSYFMCLQSIDVLYCNVEDVIVRYILTNCPFLKRFIVGDILRITDGDLFRLCAECEFLYLEELWLSCAKYLTTTSVQLLMGHCPNLKSLGQLTGWDVSPADIDYLRTVITSSNNDLVLLPTTYP
ncbi:hypothetical protein RI129_004859 [Pyrocoelia pectoralis]|uniref:Uncharacterized protein n=1 Tax=Pyrocoelia pectoralis TaxID=417401 RepID=A0AAN7VDQ3_9COLE